MKVIGVVLSLGVAASAQPVLQPSFSIDWEGPTISLPDLAAGVPITEGDILIFAGGAPPTIWISGGMGPPAPGLGLPLHAPAIGHPPGMPGAIEVDAMSYGQDAFVRPVSMTFWSFSVDEFARGMVPPPPLPPNVNTEGITGTAEASADIFQHFPPGGMPPGMLPPLAAPSGDTQIFDGDGVAPGAAPPLGLIEPNPPAPGPVVLGDNIDALDMEPAPGSFPVYFSLDSVLFDPIEGMPNSGSAVANGGFSGADVLVTPAPGAPPVIYAPAAALGLDLMGPDTDDIDALVLHENGDGVYTPSVAPFDWVGGVTDMLLFSVRRGSAIIGTPDVYSGVPIEEGDVLTAGGPPGSPPGLWIAAENLGLWTFRLMGPGPFGPFGDDLDALDVAKAPEFIRGDCNATALVDIADPIFLLSFLFAAGVAPPCDDACDSNDSGALDIADAVFTLSALFGGGPLPAAPYPGCGFDPTPDTLGCNSFPPCP